ncbi:MAG: tetratricopeptide repeat protein [Deltaproteobacteria bacterium]|nr:tetratricopeptide repeat protein [Deltaproteobacteria bacterium]
MKTPRLILALSLCFFVLSCAGGKPVRRPHRHLTEGSRKIEKGLQWYQKGCYRKSLNYFFRAYELYSASDLEYGVAMSLNNIGTVYRALGNYDRALAFFEEAQAIYSDSGNREGTVRALSNKAATLIEMGNLDAAEEIIEQALTLPSAGKNAALFTALLQNKGVLLTKRGRYREAEKALKSCLSNASGLEPADIASLNSAFGNLMLQAGRPTDAVSAFKKALVLDRKLGFYRGIADDLFYMGIAFLRLGQKEKAVNCWKRCVKVFALIDLPEKVQQTMKYLRETAGKAGIDIKATEAFLERWRQGMLYESLCGD